VLALGNRPQGSNKFYMTMVYFWGIIMAYLIFASIYITVVSIQRQVAANAFTVGQLFSNPLFRTLIVSLASTYIMWFVASFLFFEPWHMFHSVSPFHTNSVSSLPSSNDLPHSSSSTFSLPQPTSISSTSTPSATPTTSPGAPKATTKPRNCPP